MQYLALSLTAILFHATPAGAQLDPTSTMLLQPSTTTSTKQILDSPRYKVRTPEPRRETEDSVEESAGELNTAPVPRSQDIHAQKSLKPTSKPKVVEPTPQQDPAQELASAPEEIPVSEQVKKLLMGGTDEDIEEYRTKVHPQDPRANMLNISIAPAYFYTDSSSNYSYRNYHSHGSGFGLGMNVWLTPFLGIQSQYFSSVSSGIRESSGNVSPMDTQIFEAGIRFRKHFGYSRKSSRLSWGIDYHDAANKIATEASSTVGRKTSGLSLSLEATIPSSVGYAHTLDVAIRPFQHHSELKTSTEARSGTKSQTNSVSFGTGGKWTLDRKNQMFWRTQLLVERNLFSGAATKPEANGATPNGVSTTNSLMIFYFGFTWGS